MCAGFKDSVNNFFTDTGSRQWDDTHMYGQTGSMH